MQHSLLYAALTASVTALVYALVGRRVSTRAVSPDAKLAQSMFVVWWYGLAGVSLVGGFNSAMAALGHTDLAFYVTLTHVAIVLLCLALAGLVYYFAYLFTGNRAWFRIVLAFHAVLYIALEAFISYQRPNAVDIGRWSATIKYEQTYEGPVLLLLIVAILAPALVGALAYFSLFFRVHGADQRYRIALVGGAIVIWFGSSVVASLVGLNRTEWWQPVSRLIGITAALVILMASDPPRWMQRRFGLRAAEPRPAAT